MRQMAMKMIIAVIVITVIIITVIIITAIMITAIMMVTSEKKREKPSTKRFLVEFKSTN